MNTIDKIKTIEEVVEIARKLREQGKTIVTTNGSFDILHAAHVNGLEKAKTEGDFLIVLLNSDSSIKKNKGDKRPIIPQEERARMLAALQCVDYVAIFNEQKPLEHLAKIKPHIHTKGAEIKGETRALLSKWGGKYISQGLEIGLSTTDIIKRIVERYKENY